MKRVFIFLFTLMIATSTFSFNGKREGFVLGFGMNYSPSASWKIDNQDSDYESGNGIGIKLTIGYGINETDMILFESNGVYYKSDRFKEQILQQFSGASWYHYFKPGGNTFFTNAGFGFYAFNVDGYESINSDIGLQIGTGYEFSHHWQVGAYFNFGSSYSENYTYKHRMIVFSIEGIAF